MMRHLEWNGLAMLTTERLRDRVARPGQQGDEAMHDQPPRRWQQWRIRLVSHPAESDPGPLARRTLAIASAAAGSNHKTAERPGDDGIRHELVARIRSEIEAGTYDTEEKWLLAEARLLRHAEGIC